VFALERTGKCPQVLEVLRDQDYENTDIFGEVDGSISYAWLALSYAACLKSTGRQEEALALGKRILALVENAIANGQPPNYFIFLARTQMLLDDQDAALTSLRKGLQQYSLSWADLSLHDFDSLRPSPEFQQIEQVLQDHMNSERAKLGWDPIEL